MSHGRYVRMGLICVRSVRRWRKCLGRAGRCEDGAAGYYGRPHSDTDRIEQNQPVWCVGLSFRVRLRWIHRCSGSRARLCSSTTRPSADEAAAAPRPAVRHRPTRKGQCRVAGLTRCYLLCVPFRRRPRRASAQPQVRFTPRWTPGAEGSPLAGDFCRHDIRTGPADARLPSALAGGCALDRGADRAAVAAARRGRRGAGGGPPPPVMFTGHRGRLHRVADEAVSAPVKAAQQTVASRPPQLADALLPRGFGSARLQ